MVNNIKIQLNYYFNVIKVYNGTDFVDISSNIDYTTISNDVAISINPFRYRGYYYDTETGFYYLVSRYDTTTGQWIEVNDRIGALDRKLRVVNEQCDSEPDWYNWTLEAFKSTYGYEWQGDSLLIARENLLFTFIDYYIAKFENFPIKEYLIEVAKILSWNIWQMDGLKYVIPNSCKPTPKKQMT